MPVNPKILKEHNFYLRLPDYWKKANCGKHVVIKDQRIIDTYSSYEDALKQGLKEFGNVSFLIHKIGSENKVHLNTPSLIEIY